MRRWAATWRWLARTPRVVPADAFTATRTSDIHKLVGGLAVVTMFELPIVHLLAHRASFGWHLGIVALNVYTLVWLFGQRRLMQESWHRLDGEALHLGLAGHWQGAVPLGDLEAVARIAGPRPARGVLRVTPVDAPNVELRLRRPVTLRGRLGLGRSATRVQLFVDEPDALVAALEARRSAQTSAAASR